MMSDHGHHNDRVKIMVNDKEQFLSDHADNEKRQVESHMGEEIIQYPRILIDDNGKIYKNDKKHTSIAQQQESDRLLLNSSAANDSI